MGSTPHSTLGKRLIHAQQGYRARATSPNKKETGRESEERMQSETAADPPSLKLRPTSLDALLPSVLDMAFKGEL
jgi:hypothetical protein